MHALILILVSFVVAAFGSIVGAGGGFLLMPALLMMYPAESTDKLTYISLFAVLVNAVTASVSYTRLGRVDYRSALLLGLCTVPTSILGRITQHYVERSRFAMLFGMLLIAIAAFILWRIRRHGDRMHPHMPLRPNWVKRIVTDSLGIEFVYGYDWRLAAGMGLMVGFIGAFFGVGGGILVMPMMTQFLNFPPYVAAATSIVVLSVSTLTAVGTDLMHHFNDVPFSQALLAGAGAFMGAFVGTFLARWVSGKRIMYLLAFALTLAGVRLLFEKPHDVPVPDHQPSNASETSPATHP